MTAIMSMREPFLRDGIWYYELDRKRLSLKTRDKIEATRLFKAIQREYLDGKTSRITGSCSKRLGDFSAEVMEILQETAPENSWRGMRSTIRRLLPVAGSTTRLDRLTPKHWDQYAAQARKDKLTSKTLRTYQTHLRGLMAKAVSWGLLPADPWAKCKLAKEFVRPPEFLLPEQVTPFLDSIKDDMVRRLAAVLVFTGRRIGEAVALEWQNVDLQGLKYKIWIPKLNKWQWFPMHPALSDALAPVQQDIGRVFSRWRTGCAAGHSIKEALRHAGLGHLRPHDLRHTFASLVILAGNDLKIAQELLGHGSYKSTLRYAHLTPSAVAAGLSRVQFAYSGGKSSNITISDE